MHDARLGDYLTAECFPAGTDEIMATLIRSHAPVRLLVPLSRLARTTTFGSVAEVEAALAGGAPLTRSAGRA